MNMVRHHVSLDNFYAFPFAQISDILLDIRPELIVNDFSAVFWRENNMILAHPFRSVYKELHADRETGC